MRKSFFIVLLSTLVGCSNFSPNEYQVRSTKKNLHCFEQLVEKIQQDEALSEQITKIRNSKTRGFIPLRAKQNYRLIKPKEIEKFTINLWSSACSKQIIEDRDFRGLRYIDKDSIIVEIDEFDRKTMSERYSRYGTIEIHRLIIAQGEIKNRSFRYPSEKIKFIEKLENGWLYEISQRAGN